MRATRAVNVRERGERKASAKKAPARKATAKEPKAPKAAKESNGHAHPDIVANRNAESLRTLSHEPSIEGAVKARCPRPSSRNSRRSSMPRRPAMTGLRNQVRRLSRARAHRGGQGKREVRIYTRNGNDWTAKFRKQVKALDATRLESGWLDGEAVVLDERGVPDFQALQNAFDVRTSAGHRRVFVRRAVSERLRPARRAARAAPRDPASALVRTRSTIRCCASRRTSTFTPRTCSRARATWRSKASSASEATARYVSGRSRDVDQAQVQAPPGVRDRRLFGTIGQPRAVRRAAARRLRRRTANCSTPDASAPASITRRSRAVKKELDKRETRRMPFASEPQRTQPHAGALGEARARGRMQFRGMDQGAHRATSIVRQSA